MLMNTSGKVNFIDVLFGIAGKPGLIARGKHGQPGRLRHFGHVRCDGLCETGQTTS